MKKLIAVAVLLVLLLMGCTRNEEEQDTEASLADDCSFDSIGESDTMEPMQFPEIELPDDEL